MNSLTGKFIFGDIANGRIFYADAEELIAADDSDPTTMATVRELNLLRDGEPVNLLELVADTLGLASVNRVDLRFGMDFDGNLYVTTKQDGVVRRLVPEPSVGWMLLFGVPGLSLLVATRPTHRSQTKDTT